ncbi:hypothetical protein CRI94_14370 [Longibacter salinarum]|uniref:Uncharacterized protein n=1 Tax=Longibacter salinarum TaxID=1850348 RepID=A0A2A8CUU6_9BACT|nr:DUF6544 family protein [Longibacter salinarum]PEN12221.1 hypothetical protein CRI94_14370 [Longibacter salinarum]
MWLKILVVILIALIAIYAAAFLYGASRWQTKTQELRDRLEFARSPLQQRTVDFRELDDLPAPVQRYFRTVLEDGQPIVTSVHVQHDGTFNTSETDEHWSAFTSEQWVVTDRPGFVWNGRVAMAPGLPVRVHDAYVSGQGILHVSLLGAVSVADLRGKGELARGELMRYFAEATWYPTALLPSQGVTWEAVDDHSAYGTLTDGDNTITLLFSFNDEGLIDTVRAEARGRTVEGEVVPTPWRGRFWNYEERDGMLVPADGEVAWLLPDGERPYWRGHITDLGYEFAD